VVKKKAWVAAVLSIMPGLGHLYAGQPRKAAALGFIDAAVIAGIFFVPLRTAFVLAVMIYALTVPQAALESAAIIRTGRSDIRTSPKAYVVFLLLSTGFNALPMLWQDERFSKGSKIAWSAAVTVLALLFFGGLAAAGQDIEAYLRTLW
jgi:hypothetical protein